MIWKWFRALFVDHPITEKELDEKIKEVLKNLKINYCKDCKYICKPTGAPYEPHPESLCLAGGLTNYVTGENEHWLCKYQNSNGYCPLFAKKEAP